MPPSSMRLRVRLHGGLDHGPRVRSGPLAIAVAAAAMTLAGCDFPRDGRGSLERIRFEHRLRAGVTASAPAVILAGGAPPSGEEIDLLRGWAMELNAEIVWTSGSAINLVERLKRGELDVLAAGLPAKNPWRAEIALTKPYRDEGHTVLAVAPGESALLLSLDRYLARRRGATR